MPRAKIPGLAEVPVADKRHGRAQRRQRRGVVGREHEVPAVLRDEGALALRVRARFGLDPAQVPLRLITNGSLVGQARVQQGLRQLGEAGGEVWFKVDAGTSAAIERINGIRLTPEAMARNLARCAELCATWVQTCMFCWDGTAPTDADIEAYLAVLERAGLARLRGVLLYGIARPSMQAEAVHLSALEVSALQAIAARIEKKGLTVRVSP